MNKAEAIKDILIMVAGREESITRRINSIQPTTDEAWEVIKKEYELPNNFLDLWEKSGEHRGIFNTIEFELSEKGDDRTAEQFIFDYLEIYKTAEYLKADLDKLVKYESLNLKIGNILKIDLEELVERVIVNGLEKPQKVVIPKFVDDWLARDVTSLRRVFYMLERGLIVDKKVSEWIDKNEELLCAAYANGYEVEKEKLYYVVLPEEIDSRNVRVLKKYPNGEVNIGLISKLDLRTATRIRLTEQEIKSIDERYFAFAVEVEGEEE